jgi:hypothetical protein
LINLDPLSLHFACVPLDNLLSLIDKSILSVIRPRADLSWVVHKFGHVVPVLFVGLQLKIIANYRLKILAGYARRRYHNLVLLLR